MAVPEVCFEEGRRRYEFAPLFDSREGGWTGRHCQFVGICECGAHGCGKLGSLNYLFGVAIYILMMKTKHIVEGVRMPSLRAIVIYSGDLFDGREIGLTIRCIRKVAKVGETNHHHYLFPDK